MAEKPLREPLNPESLGSVSTEASAQGGPQEQRTGGVLSEMSSDCCPSSEVGPLGVAAQPSLFQEVTECRLCFDGSDQEGLFAPCDCSGSMRWVHRSCLNQYRYHAQPTQQKAMTHCPTCAYEYQLYCTFDVTDQRRRKGKRRLRCARDGVLVSAGFLFITFLLGELIKLCDAGTGNTLKRLIHWPGMYHGHGALHSVTAQPLFLYWSLALAFVLLLTSIVGLVILGVACCRGGGNQVREPRIAYGRRENCCDDCNRGCFYIDPMYADPCCCGTGADCSSGAGGACVCDGEAGLILLAVVVVALIVLGIFVALLVLSMALQRTGQRYLKALHLKDVADRFAIVDRGAAVPTHSSSSSNASGVADAPEAQSMDEGATGSSALSQETIRGMLQEEIKLTSGIIRNRVRDVVGQNDVRDEVA